MGAFYSKPFIQIQDTKLTFKEFIKLKTYKDILKVAGHTVDDTATIRKINKQSEYISVGEPFKFGGTLIYEDKAIYIQILY